MRPGGFEPPTRGLEVRRSFHQFLSEIGLPCLVNRRFLPDRLVTVVAGFCDEDAVQNVVPHERKPLYRQWLFRLDEVQDWRDAFVVTQPDH